MVKKLALLVVLCVSMVHAAQKSRADFVIFSYDRPMQLNAFLESIEKYMTGIASTQVIYRATSDDYEVGYVLVKEKYKTVTFIKQSDNAYKDFKPLLIKALFTSGTVDYFLMGVDDLIVTDYIDVSSCIAHFEKHSASGFFLRMGTNITECYTLGFKTPVPKLTSLSDGIYSWKFVDGVGDWEQPATTDMTIYRKKDWKSLFEQIKFVCPNDFEQTWIAAADKNATGLCFEYSKNINIPVNIVQSNKSHRNMGFFSTEELLEEFLDGVRIDISSFEKMRNNAPHIEVIPEFSYMSPSTLPA